MVIFVVLGYVFVGYGLFWFGVINVVLVVGMIVIVFGILLVLVVIFGFCCMCNGVLIF